MNSCGPPAHIWKLFVGLGLLFWALEGGAIRGPGSTIRGSEEGQERFYCHRRIPIGRISASILFTALHWSSSCSSRLALLALAPHRSIEARRCVLPRNSKHFFTPFRRRGGGILSPTIGRSRFFTSALFWVQILGLFSEFDDGIFLVWEGWIRRSVGTWRTRTRRR